MQINKKPNLTGFTASEVEFLDEDLVGEVKSHLYNLKKHWVRVDGIYGHSMQLFISDGEVSGNAYQSARKIQSYNEILWENFGWLYLLLKDRCEEVLHIKVDYDINKILPGFIIFPFTDNSLEKPTNRIYHVDHNFKPPFSPLELIKKPSIAVTVPICGPKNFGLRTINRHAYEVTGDFSDKDKEELQGQASTFYPYRIGNIFLHNGRIFHKGEGYPQFPGDTDRVILHGSITKENNRYVFKR